MSRYEWPSSCCLAFSNETEKLMADRLPQPEDPLGVGPDPQANCLVVGGRPMCVQKMDMKLGSSEPDGKVLEDRQKSKAPASSVPSPRFCD